MSIFEYFQVCYEVVKDEELFIQDFLVLCKENKSVYVNVVECLLLVIGEFEMIDIFKYLCFSCIFFN